VYGLTRDLKEALLGRQPKVPLFFLCFSFFNFHFFWCVLLHALIPLILFMPCMFMLRTMYCLSMGDGYFTCDASLFRHVFLTLH